MTISNIQLQPTQCYFSSPATQFHPSPGTTFLRRSRISTRRRSFRLRRFKQASSVPTSTHRRQRGQSVGMGMCLGMGTGNVGAFGRSLSRTVIILCFPFSFPRMDQPSQQASTNKLIKHVQPPPSAIHTRLSAADTHNPHPSVTHPSSPPNKTNATPSHPVSRNPHHAPNPRPRQRSHPVSVHRPLHPLQLPPTLPCPTQTHPTPPRPQPSPAQPRATTTRTPYPRPIAQQQHAMAPAPSDPKTPPPHPPHDSTTHSTLHPLTQQTGPHHLCRSANGLCMRMPTCRQMRIRKQMQRRPTPRGR